MYEYGNDIIKFNTHDQNLELALKAKGQEVQDLILHLFKGYDAYSDEKFRDYVEMKKYEYEDGEDTTSVKLMTFAENRYNNMKRDNVWNELSPDQEKIVALSSTVKGLQDNNLKLGNAIENKGNTRNSRTINPKNDLKYAWKKVPPKDSKPKTKQVKDKSYHWYHTHQMWTINEAHVC